MRNGTSPASESVQGCDISISPLVLYCGPPGRAVSGDGKVGLQCVHSEGGHHLQSSGCVLDGNEHVFLAIARGHLAPIQHRIVLARLARDAIAAIEYRLTERHELGLSGGDAPRALIYIGAHGIARQSDGAVRTGDQTELRLAPGRLYFPVAPENALRDVLIA